VVLANQDLDAISKELQIGLTPVIISNSIEWLSLDGLGSGARIAQERDRPVAHRLGESRVERISPITRRSSSPMVRTSISGRRRSGKSAAARVWIKVATDNLSMFRNPGKEEMVVVTFAQGYRSNNLSNVMKKRQYWVKEGGRWKIAYEGAG